MPYYTLWLKVVATSDDDLHRAATLGFFVELYNYYVSTLWTQTGNVYTAGKPLTHNKPDDVLKQLNSLKHYLIRRGYYINNNEGVRYKVSHDCEYGFFIGVGVYINELEHGELDLETLEKLRNDAERYMLNIFKEEVKIFGAFKLTTSFLKLFDE